MRSFEATDHFMRGVGSKEGLRCPGGVGQVDTGFVPPLDVSCAKAPEGRCKPGVSYEGELWSHAVWKELGLQQDASHRFHYRFVGRDSLDGEPGCAFTVQAFGDLDDDGVYSTFERSGFYNAGGMNAAAGLYIDPPGVE